MKTPSVKTKKPVKKPPAKRPKLITRKEFASKAGITYAQVCYLLTKRHIDETEERLIDINSEKALAVISRYKRAGKQPNGREGTGLKRTVGRLRLTDEEMAARGSYSSMAVADKPAPKPQKGKDYCKLAEQYALDVVDGKINHGKRVKQACQRFLKDLERQDSDGFPFVFDKERANARCARIEQLPHIKGKWARDKELVVLQPWQCFHVCNIFGWVHAANHNKRRFREVYHAVPRKNAKSTLAAAIGIIMLIDDGEHGAEVYAGATSEKQAWEVFGPARLMLKGSQNILDECRLQVWARSIVKATDNSKFWPLIGKPGDGASPSCAIVDEYHEHKDTTLVDAMQTGMGAREQPLLLIITTAGVSLTSPCYDKHKEARSVLDGTFENEQLFVLIYEPDEGDDWTKVETLRKCNPNMGVSVDEDYLLAQLKQAVQNPQYQTRFKTKHLNEWCSASVAGINMEDWKKCADPTLKVEQFYGEECVNALDLASKIDVCANVKLFTRMIEGKKHYYAFGRYYVPEQTIEEAHINGSAYKKWVIEGHLVATPGAEVDFDIVGEDVNSDKRRFAIREIVYDPWRATQLAHQLGKDGATVVEMTQNPKNMGEAFDEFLAAIKTGRFHHDGSPVLTWMASNVVARTVTKGLIVPGKDSNDAKIDGIVACIMCVSRSLAVTPNGLMGWLASAVRA